MYYSTWFLVLLLIAFYLQHFSHCCHCRRHPFNSCTWLSPSHHACRTVFTLFHNTINLQITLRQWYSAHLRAHPHHGLYWVVGCVLTMLPTQRQSSDLFFSVHVQWHWGLCEHAQFVFTQLHLTQPGVLPHHSFCASASLASPFLSHSVFAPHGQLASGTFSGIHPASHI